MNDDDTKEVEHGLNEDGMAAFYTWVGPGLLWPHFICACGAKFKGENWEEAGAEFDEHLRKNGTR